MDSEERVGVQKCWSEYTVALGGTMGTKAMSTCKRDRQQIVLR